MKITNIYKTTAALIFLMVAILAPVQEAWGQVTEDRYETIGGVSWITVNNSEVSIASSNNVTGDDNIYDTDRNTYASISDGSTGTITLNVGGNHSVDRITLNFNSQRRRPSSITVFTSDSQNGNYTQIGSASNINGSSVTITLNQSAEQSI